MMVLACSQNDWDSQIALKDFIAEQQGLIFSGKIKNRFLNGIQKDIEESIWNNELHTRIKESIEEGKN
jgi:hypothetical protein